MGRRLSSGLPSRLLILLLLGSLVLAATAAPLLLGSGLVAKAVADHFLALPAQLPSGALAQRSLVLDSTGRELAVLHGPEDRVLVDLQHVAPVMQQAVVAIEDARFYLHHGVDYRGLLRAVVHNARGGSEQGASTLTQQYVKLVLLESAHTAAERAAVTSRSSYDRKLREARLALALEHKLSKQQILGGYLNIAYFGQGAYGVQEAARHYFGVQASALDLPQSALLAGLVNSPSLFDPSAHPQAARLRRRLVLARMAAENMITQSSAHAAALAPLGVHPEKAAVVTDACASSTAPFFCDWVRTQLRADPLLGSTQGERDRRIFDGGLRVQTTLDPAVQAAAQQAVDSVVPRTNPTTAVIVIVQPGTGKVLAMAANRTYSPDKGIGRTSLGYLGYRPIFQGGSTFKAFTLLAAIKQGVPLSTSFYAPPCFQPDPASWDVPGPAGACPGGYQNSDPADAGYYDAVQATWKSVNTYFIQLEQQVGIPAIINAAEAVGIRPAAFQGLSPRSLSLTLGAVEGVSPLEEASAYATLAAHGLACTPYGVAGATDANSRPLPLSTARGCRQTIDATTADTVTGLLRGVLEQPAGTAAGKLITGHDAAGKSGTLDNESAAWFVGFTSQLAGAVVLGDPGAPSRPLGTVEGVNPVYGGTLPATIWQRALTAASANLPSLPLPPAVLDTFSLPAAPNPFFSPGLPVAPTYAPAPNPSSSTPVPSPSPAQPSPTTASVSPRPAATPTPPPGH